MNSKERVRNALARKPVDRVPVWMWFHPSTARNLAALLEIPAARLAEVMGDDIRQTWVNNNYAMEGVVQANEGDTYTDDWGITWRKEGEFNQIVRSPLADADDAACLAYEFPWNRFEFLMDRMTPVVQQAETYYIGCDVSPCLYEMYSRIRGMEQATLDLVMNPDLAAAMLEKCGDFSVALAKSACERLPLDWLWLGDDVAGQQAPIMSPNLWRELIKPQLARIAAVGHAHGLPVAYHCCGAVRPLIPDLIEIGVNILNPVQCNCPGMDPADLKREFGADLSFMGGVDTVHLLPRASAAEVRAETERLVDAMTADGGGYILAASHTVPPETPPYNVFALYEGAGIMKGDICDRAAVIRRVHPV